MPRATDIDHPIDESTSASNYNADQTDATFNRRRRHHQRIIAAPKSLRFGCLLDMVAAAVFCVICGSGIAKMLLKLPLPSWKELALTVFLWACEVVLWPEPRLGTPSTRSRMLAAARSAFMLLPTVLAPAAAVYAVLPIVSLWRSVFSIYVVSLGEALAYSMGITALTLLLSTDILLRTPCALFEPYAEKSLYEPSPISTRIHNLRDQLR